MSDRMTTPTDSKQRFSNRVADYVAGRPAYPATVLDVLAERIGFDQSWHVADIGAGTGISTRLFLEAGNKVTAIEPNADMRAAAPATLGQWETLTVANGTAEATGLKQGSVDLIVAAQAFHWFDKAAFFREANRILTSRGRVLLMWNNRTTGNTPFGKGFEQIVAEFCVEHRHDRHGLSTDNLSPWFEPGTYHYVELPNDQVQDYDSVTARLASSSYMPHRGHPKFEPMIAALKDLFVSNAVDGYIVLPHVTELYLGRPRELT
jgi:SAM-dependent methyltransferase